uniref:Uncharacterized protein n=1 Tax=Bionectria ochroleuca TaxID=29856 RepID=A0A8H7NNP7_BIOOC
MQRVNNPPAGCCSVSTLLDTKTVADLASPVAAGIIISVSTTPVLAAQPAQCCLASIFFILYFVLTCRRRFLRSCGTPSAALVAVLRLVQNRPLNLAFPPRRHPMTATARLS